MGVSFSLQKMISIFYIGIIFQKEKYMVALFGKNWEKYSLIWKKTATFFVCFGQVYDVQAICLLIDHFHDSFCKMFILQL